MPTFHRTLNWALRLILRVTWLSFRPKSRIAYTFQFAPMPSMHSIGFVCAHLSSDTFGFFFSNSLSSFFTALRDIFKYQSWYRCMRSAHLISMDHTLLKLNERLAVVVWMIWNDTRHQIWYVRSKDSECGHPAFNKQDHSMPLKLWPGILLVHSQTMRTFLQLGAKKGRSFHIIPSNGGLQGNIILAIRRLTPIFYGVWSI